MENQLNTGICPICNKEGILHSDGNCIFCTDKSVLDYTENNIKFDSREFENENY